MTDDPRDPRFWDEDAADFWVNISPTAIDIYLDGAQGGIDLLPANVQALVDTDRLTGAASTFARSYRYDDVQGITDTTRKQVQQALADWVASGSPLDALEAALEPILGADRADRIAVTEATRVFARGNMDAWETTGLVVETTWMTARDERVCPICGGLAGTHVGIGDVDAAPPAHPYCRCWLQPVVSEDAVSRKIQEILG